MIKIQVNNTEKLVEESITISELLSNLNQAEQGIAIAINNQVIFKKDWTNTCLKLNDKLLIIQATQGG